MTRERDAWGQPTQFSLTELEAFDAMRSFLEAYWRRGACSSDDLAILLSDLNRGVWADQRPGDPAQWGDWLAAIRSVRSGPP